MTGQGGTDKLARLMPGLPQYIEPLQLAESGEGISGSLPLGALQRLASLLCDRSGAVDFRLEFGKNEQGLVRIRGEYSTQLLVACQRCLEPLVLRMANPIDVALVPGALEAGQLPGEIEPLTLADGQIHLASFIEDEMLLGLPMAPRHEPGRCPQQTDLEAETGPARNRPFAVLKDYHPGKA